MSCTGSARTWPKSAIDTHFGTAAWQETRGLTGEAACKAELLKVYRESLQSIPQVKWRMDPYLGRQASEKRGLEQPGLFDDNPVLSPLRTWLGSLAGTARDFDELATQAGRLGYKESHLRTVLTSLAEDGMCVREEPLDYAKTPGVAGRAKVHRSFIHRHHDLHSAVLKTAASTMTDPSPASTAISYRSVLAENANLHEQNRRLAQQISDLEDRLSELPGKQAFDRSGLGAPSGTAAIQAELEAERQTVLDMRRELGEREEELATARETNRRLMNQLNRS
jgi:hypothetical protein